MNDSHHSNKISTNSLTKTLPDKVCRICFESETKEDPIITPCNCRGSMQHIHEKCLKSWILAQNPDPKNFDCDVCKSPVKMEIKLKRVCSCKRIRTEMIKLALVHGVIFATTAVIIVLVVLLLRENTSSSLSGKIYISVAILVCLCIDIAMVIILCRSIKRSCFDKTVKSWKIFSRAMTVAPEVTQVTEFFDRKKGKTMIGLVENIGGAREKTFMINTYKTGFSFTQRHELQNYFHENRSTSRVPGQVSEI